MGTSNSFGGAGPRSPLIPTWLGGGGAAPAGTPPGAAPPAGTPPGAPPPPVPPAPAARPPVAKPPVDNRFSGARSSFTRFARSGGTDRPSLGRALSGYVSRASGGSATAAQRMGASRSSGANLLGFLSDVNARGAAQALGALNLQGLAGLPIQDVFLGIVDYVCPDGGSLDQAIAREAFIEMIVELATLGVPNLDAMTADQMKTVFEMFATNTIEARLYNDIGLNLIQIPQNVAAANIIQDQIHAFIQRGVADAVAGISLGNQAFTPAQSLGVVNSVYQSAFDLLKALGDEEANP